MRACVCTCCRMFSPPVYATVSRLNRHVHHRWHVPRYFNTTNCPTIHLLLCCQPQAQASFLEGRAGVSSMCRACSSEWGGSQVARFHTISQSTHTMVGACIHVLTVVLHHAQVCVLPAPDLKHHCARRKIMEAGRKAGVVC